MKGNPVLLYKTLVVGVIVLFIGVGIQSAFAVTSDISDSKGGPDLKCLNLGFDNGETLHYEYLIFTCNVINIGDDYSGKVSFSGDGWRLSIFGEWELHGVKDSWNVDWKNGVTKSFEICSQFFLGVAWMPFGIYRLKFNINAEGDINPDNDEFDRYFFYCLYRFYPTIINL